MAGKHLTGQGAFDPSEVVLLLGGYNPYGFTENKIVVAKAEDNILPMVGSDGDWSVAINRNTLGTMTIGLQNTSPSNKVLAAYAIQAKTTRKVTFPVVMEDPSGMTLLSTEGWIQTQPDYTVAKEVGEMQWVIGLADATISGDLTTAMLNSIASSIL